MLPLIFTLALDTAPAAAPADGTYTYVSTIANRGAGQTQVTVKRDVSSLVFSERSSGKSDLVSGTGTAALTLDAQLAPASYEATYSFGGPPVTVKLAFDGATATERSAQGSVDYALGSAARHFVVVDGVMLSGYLALPAQMKAWENAAVMGLVPMIGKSYPLAVDATAAAPRPPAVPANDRLLAFSQPVAFTMWFDPATLVVDEIDVPSQNATIVRRK